MTFSSQFLEVLIYGALIWCGGAGLALIAMLVRDLKRGDVW